MSKYRAKKTTVDGYTFDSKKEAARYGALKILLRSGEISDLVLQPKYPIVFNGVKICDYKADFKYRANGREIVEDVKGVKTPVYRLKKKMVKAVYGIDILET